jgi:uncharacterized repeat protein (TIGR01451 family)
MQKMADVRRGWTQEDEPTTVEEFQSPQAEGNSLIPSWLGGGNQKKGNAAASQRRAPGMAQPNQGMARTTNAQPQSARRVQTGTNSANQQRSSGQGASAKRSPSSSGFALPGLGGSPLPSPEEMASQSRTGDSRSSKQFSDTLEADPDYPVIRGTAPRAPTPQSTNATSDSPRHSPVERTPRNVPADDFGRELAGAFSPASDGPAARTAQANDRPTASEEVSTDAAGSEQPLEPADSTLTVPATTDSPAMSAAPRRDTAESREDAAREAAAAFGPASNDKPAISASDFIRSQRTNTLPQRPSAARSKEAFGDALTVASGGDPSVLVSQQTPVISSDIRGPKQISIGRESVYRVRLQNQGAVAAEGIVATIRIPATAEIVGTTATQGSLQPPVADGSFAKIEWRLANLGGRGSEVLDIRLVPKEGRPLELGVNWTVAPVGSRAIVEVQEPQLKIDISGPTEVMYDKAQLFRLTLSNPGTGPAENVKISLIPPGGTPESATSHEFGNLAAGENKSVDIELTPREAGKLAVKAAASAEGGLAADVTKEIFCRKPELELDWRGPTTKFAGTPATYFFRVRNPGTAPADDVTVEVALPEGAEFESASEGQEFDAKRRAVSWRVGTLNPGDDKYMELKCVVNAPGANQLKISASNAAGDITNSSVAETKVEALADLKLTVSDPSGPVAVGSQAMYEIQVENRGADTARDVSVVALFSQGIEPDQSDGYTVADGRVTFPTIGQLPAGENVKLRVRARALNPGTHVFRAEVLCSALDIKLAAEETTRFYTDELAPEAEGTTERTASRDDGKSTR